MAAKAYFWVNLQPTIVDIPLNHFEVIGQDGRPFELTYRSALLTPGAVKWLRLYLPPHGDRHYRSGSKLTGYGQTSQPTYRLPEAFLTLVEPAKAGRPSNVFKYRFQNVAFVGSNVLWRGAHGSSMVVDMAFDKVVEVRVAQRASA